MYDKTENRASTFGLLGRTLGESFFKQLLLFAILILSIFAPVIAMLPQLSLEIDNVLAVSEVDTGTFYLGFIILTTGIKRFAVIGTIMAACAIFLSPVACGASAYLNEGAFKNRLACFGDAFKCAGKYYARLLGTYVLYVVIELALLGVFAVFMYFFLHEWSHIYAENYLTPVMTAWIAGIVLVFGCLLFSPFCALYDGKGGFAAVGRSFKLFFTGGVLYNILQLLIGGVIWAAISVLPSYIVLLSMCDEGQPIDTLLYSFSYVASAPEVYIVMIIGFTVATLFMFDYSHAVFVGAKRRYNAKIKIRKQQMLEDEERKAYESHRNRVRSGQTGYYR